MKKSRQKIPAEGKVWLDKDDIWDFFRGREETEVKKKQQLLEKSKNSVLKLSKNLEELKQKKRDVLELELAGRLSKGRKTSAELGEMEKSTVWKLNKAVGKLWEMDSSCDVAMDSDYDSDNRWDRFESPEFV